MAISAAEAEDMIAKTIQRRAAKPSLGREVAAVLARLNAKASQDKRSEGLVSQSCIVTYLASPADGLVTDFYNWDAGVKKPVLQHLSNGYDVTNLIESVLPYITDNMKRNLEAVKRGEPLDDEIDADAINDLLRRGHKEPSDELK